MGLFSIFVVVSPFFNYTTTLKSQPRGGLVDNHKRKPLLIVEVTFEP